MNTYETLITEAEKENVIVKEKRFKKARGNGFIKGNKILINKDLDTQKEKACTLAEELGHYHTTVGNILNQIDVNNKKQEVTARLWSYNCLIGLTGIIECYKHKCTNLHEMAEHLSVSEQFLNEAIKHYESKYGLCTKVDNYIVYFKPCLGVVELYE